MAGRTSIGRVGSSCDNRTSRDTPMSVHVFGIRHHGPGSARSLKAALGQLEPDAVLVEGPPDADALIPFCAHADLEPPVAILVYAPGEPRKAVFYPMASFSPEWNALCYAVERGLPAWFIDLPQANRLAEDAGRTEAEAGAQIVTATPRIDPLTHLARAAGFEDGERWWGRMVEERRDASRVFDAVLEAMTALRNELSLELEPTEARREAHMRKRIREARESGFRRIAVVCGAWHAPALSDMPSAKEDEELLKGLPSISVQATWVPWTHERLSMTSGYGAGVESPGWYHHLFTESASNNQPCDVESRWMARVARLLREKDLDASPAHVIEAVRLAECLTAMRGRPVAGLPELNDAAESVLCHGNHLYLRMIHDRLIVGQALGRVPTEAPRVPLQRDLERMQKKLRLPPAAEEKLHDLDLRNDVDLERSRLLHRLRLLGIDWGAEEPVKGKKGTFHEAWRLKWDSELAIRVIEASVWGGNIEEACAAKVCREARVAKELVELTRLLDRALLADLPEVVSGLLQCISDLSAASIDVPQLMDALPPLGNAARYGNVRETSSELMTPIVNGLVLRIVVGLPGAAASLDDAAAQSMLTRLIRVHQTIQLLEQPEHAQLWRETLEKLSNQDGLHGLIAGRSVRLLLEAKDLSPTQAGVFMHRALSRSVPPAKAAAWIEGFLKGSGLVILHGAELWAILDEWVRELSPDHFLELMPLLRRTFATFAPAERRQMGERARRGAGPSRTEQPDNFSAPFNEQRAAQGVNLVARLLGLHEPGGGTPHG